MRLFPITVPALATMALALGGCSSGGGDDVSRNGYDAYAAEASDLRQEVNALPDIDVADLPVSGTARYEGVAAFGVRMEQATETAMFGAMELVVDFAGAGDITGRIHDVVSNESALTGDGGGPVSGELRIENGTIDRAPLDPRFDPHFEADLVGTLVDDIGTLEFDAEIDGRFMGEDAAMIDGDISGRAGPDPAVMDIVTGSFVLAAE